MDEGSRLRSGAMDELERAYDVVCVGGALIGSSTAYFLSENDDFDGTVLVVEPDWTYSKASSSLSVASIREQFSNPVKILASQFGMDFIAEFHERVEVDGEAPELGFRGTGYLFLVTDDGLRTLRRNHQVQRGLGADVRLLDAKSLGATFSFLDTSNLAGASLGGHREGSLDAWAMLHGFRQRARHNGVSYVRDRVVGFDVVGYRVESVLLESGRRVGCGHVVNAAGVRASEIANMVGLALPVEPRKRSVFTFTCREPIVGDVPLTVTPEGVFFRREHDHFMAGTTPLDDPAVDYDDFEVRRHEFEKMIWPVLARWVPQFDKVSVLSAWAGQYAYNTFDQNMIVGNAPDLENFVLANGFSGRGLQHSPAVGRAVSELIVHARFVTLDLSDVGYERVIRNEPFRETAVV